MDDINSHTGGCESSCISMGLRKLAQIWGKHGVSKKEIEDVFHSQIKVQRDPHPFEKRLRAIRKTQKGRRVKSRPPYLSTYKPSWERYKDGLTSKPLVVFFFTSNNRH